MSGGVSRKLSPGNTAVTTVMDCSGVNNVCHVQCDDENYM